MNSLLESPDIAAVPVAESNRADIAREYLGEEPEP